MSLTASIKNIIEGLGSALIRAGALKEILSSAVAGGIEGGINRAMPALMRNVILGAVFLTGTFLFGTGMSKWIESMTTTPGLGFVLTGLVFLAAGSLYLHTRQ